jgi:hypothetical protein
VIYTKKVDAQAGRTGNSNLPQTIANGETPFAEAFHSFPKNNSRKVTITLSLNESVVKELRNEAELAGASLNSRINSILDKYVRFYRNAETLDSVVIPQTQFLRMLQLMDEGPLTQILEEDGTAAVLSILNNFGIPHTLDNMIQYCYGRIILWSGAYSTFTSRVDNEGYPCLIFEHKFGMKWSRILAKAATNTIGQVLSFPSEVRIMPSTVVVRVIGRGAAPTEKGRP